MARALVSVPSAASRTGSGALAMIGGARVVIGVFLSTVLAGGALAAQARRGPRGRVANPTPILAIHDPLAAAMAAAIDNGVADGISSSATRRGSPPSTRRAATSRLDRRRQVHAAALTWLRASSAREDGLDPADYALPWTEVGLYLDARDEKIARADLQLSQAVALYARHAYSGRVTPSEVSSNLNYKLNPPAAADAGLVAGRRPGRTLEAYNPPQPEFAALRAELRGSAPQRRPRRAGAWPRAAAQAGDERSARAGHPRAAPARLATIDPELYDDDLVEAVKGFQASAGLRTDGIVGKNTVSAMNSAGADPVETILLNMERWRWMPRDLGDFYVRVNVPTTISTLSRRRGRLYDARSWSARPAPRRRSSPTRSSTSSSTRTGTCRPRSCGRRCCRRFGRAAASAATRSTPRSAAGSAPSTRGWSTGARSMTSIQVRQPPGERNALGEIKFMFPNQYDVYLHDTPSKSLFERDFRAFSHGCMRVMNPWDFAEALLSDTDRSAPLHSRSRSAAARAGQSRQAYPGAHHLFHRLGGRERRASGPGRHLRSRQTSRRSPRLS